jgi:hypothetical protein
MMGSMTGGGGGGAFGKAFGQGGPSQDLANAFFMWTWENRQKVFV